MQLITQSNVFNPSEREIVLYDAGQTLAELAPETHQPFILFLNGEVILREQWDDLVACEDDIVHCVYLPAGGGGGGGNKAAGIAIAVIAIAAAVVVGPAALAFAGTQLGLGSAGAAAFSSAAVAATTMAGAVLVNAVLPPPSLPRQQQQAALAAPSPTYDLNAQGNYSRLGQVIPVQYGRMKFFPDYGAKPISEYTGQAMNLTELFVIGRGYYDIEEIQLGGVPVQSVGNVYYYIYNPGETVDTFPTNRIFTSVNESGLPLPNGTPTNAYETNPPGTVLSGRVVLNMVFPNGLYDIYESNWNGVPAGGLGAVTLGWDIQGQGIADDGTVIADWDLLKKVSVRGETRDRLGVTHEVEIPSNWPRARIRLNFFQETSNTYQTMMNDLVWVSTTAYIVEDSAQATAFDDMTTLVVRSSTGVNQTSAPQQNRKVSVIATRRVPIYDSGSGTWSEPQATRSVAWAFADAVRNGTYGAGLGPNEYSIDDVVKLAQEAQGWRFDGRFDNATVVWEVLTQILRAARAQPYIQGGVLRIAKDRDQTTPVAMFGMRNIIKDSFSMEFVPPGEETADIVAVQYLDEDVWLPRVVAAAWNAGDPVDPDDTEVLVDLFGVVNRDYAYNEAYYLARANRFRRRLISFRTEMEGFIPSLGDLISVSHELPSWGVSGEVVGIDPDNNATLILSEPLDWASNPTQFLVLRQRDGVPRNVMQATRGATDYHAVLQAPQSFIDTGTDRERTYFAAGGTTDKLDRLAIVTGVRPISEKEVEISATIDSLMVRTLPPVDAPTPPGPPPIQEPCLAPVVTDLSVSTDRDFTVLYIAFSAPECATLFDYQIANTITSDPNAILDEEWETILWQDSRRGVTVPNTYGVGVWVRVRAYGATVGPWTEPEELKFVATPPGGGYEPKPLLEPPTPVDMDATIEGFQFRPLAAGLEPHWVDTDSEYLRGVNVWINTIDDPDTAWFVATATATVIEQDANPVTPGFFEVYGLTSNTTYFVWLQSVNTDGVGGLFSAPVITGTTYYTWEDLQGELDESWLTEELNDRIDNIEDLMQEVDDIQQEIEDSNKFLQDQIDDLNNSIGDLEGISDYDPARDYTAGDLVVYNGFLFRANKDMTAPAPVPGSAADVDSNSWLKLGDYDYLASDLTALTAVVTQNTSDIQENEAGIEANASQITSILAKVDDPDTGNAALGNAVDALGTRVTTNEGNIQVNSGKITDIESLVYDGETGNVALASVTEQLTTDVALIDGELTAMGGRLTVVEAQVGSGNLITDANLSTGFNSWTETGNTPVTVNFYRDGSYALISDGEEQTAVIATNGAQGSDVNSYGELYSLSIPVTPGKHYCASVYAIGQYANARLLIKYYSATNTYIFASGTPSATKSNLNGNRLEDFDRVFVFDTAPINAVKAVIALRLYATGTDSTRVGTAKFVRPMFNEMLTDTATEPPLWTSGEAPVSAEIRKVQIAYAAADSAIAQDVTTLEAQVDYNGSGGGQSSPLGQYVDSVKVTATAADNLSKANAQSITQLQVGVGPSGNLLQDSTFQLNPPPEIPMNGVSTNTPWERFYSSGTDKASDLRFLRQSTDPYSCLDGYENEGTFYQAVDAITTGAPLRVGLRQKVPATEGRAYIASAHVMITYSAQSAATVTVGIKFWSSRTVEIANSTSFTETRHYNSNFQSLSAYKRASATSPMVAPSNVKFVSIELRYTALNNNEPSGSAKIVRPMLSEATDINQSEPTPWAAGRDPEVFAAIQETMTVWAEKVSGTGTGSTDAGATYVMKIRAGSQFSEAQAGFGMSALYNSSTGKYETDFRIKAQRFAILDNNSNLSGTNSDNNYPFVVTGGVCYIKNAVIQNGAITTVKIGDAQITEAKIANLAVTTAKIKDANITEAKIGTAAVTNAKIKDAQITAAKVATAAIETLKVKGAAVTSVYFADMGQLTVTSAAWVNGSGIGIDMKDKDSTSAVVITVSYSMGGTQTVQSEVRVRRNDGWYTKTRSAQLNANTGAVVTVMLIDPAPINGANYYTLELHTQSGSMTSNWNSIAVQGAKR
jgi:hypothetical protein